MPKYGKPQQVHAYPYANMVFAKVCIGIGRTIWMYQIGTWKHGKSRGNCRGFQQFPWEVTERELLLKKMLGISTKFLKRLKSTLFSVCQIKL